MIVIRRGRARSASFRPNEIDEVVRSLISGQRGAGVRSQQHWRPALDVFTTEAALEVVAELAGMSSDQIDVMVEGDILSIRGTRERPEAQHVRSFYEARIPFGPFLAEVAIPFEIQWEKTTADYSNGLLRVSLPRRPARTVTVRQVEVLDEEESEYR
ncbi:hypothetical protein BH23CHL3_BH23CHL3_07670 [soil metagenome]